jgi:gamma-glutamyltranspeptidase/glutathione hydrolase
MAVLEDGGNAADAAVAVGFALQAVEPHLNGPGGEVPILLAGPLVRAAGQPCQVLCGQGPVPRRAEAAALRVLGLEQVPGTGWLAACVPGSFDAWCTLLAEHGTMSLRRVLTPAIGYALGHPLLPAAAATIAQLQPTFEADWPTSASVWLPGGRPPKPWRIFANPVLAATWQRLLDEAEAAGRDRVTQIDAARRSWREGFIAEAIAAAVRKPVRDSSGELHAGLLDGDDLAAWSAHWESPVTRVWRGLTIAKTGPWGQGPALLAWLGLLGDDIPSVGDAAGIHQAVEAAKLAYADRDAWYADPEAVDVPLEELLSPSYLDQRRSLITDQASLELRPGAPGGRSPRLPAILGSGATATDRAGIGEPTVDRRGRTRGDTVHLDVIDRWGNVVSATPSGGWLQSSPVVAELGFPLGTRAQMTWLEDGLPATLRGGTRPRTTLTPSIALAGDDPVMGFGTPGGDQQDQWQLVFLLRHLVEGLGLQEAVDAPAWHTTAFPSSFYPREWTPGEVIVESEIGDAAIADLRARGHRVIEAPGRLLGRLCAVTREADTGVIRAAATSRGRQCSAAGR